MYHLSVNLTDRVEIDKSVKSKLDALSLQEKWKKDDLEERIR